MWDLPRPGMEPVSPALTGGFLSTAQPVKPFCVYLKLKHTFRTEWSLTPIVLPWELGSEAVLPGQNPERDSPTWKQSLLWVKLKHFHFHASLLFPMIPAWQSHWGLEKWIPRSQTWQEKRGGRGGGDTFSVGFSSHANPPPPPCLPIWHLHKPSSLPLAW